MARIVTTTYRYKRPRNKKRSVTLEVPVVVGPRRRVPPPADGQSPPEPAARPPASDDRKPAIVTTTSRKRLKLLRADQQAAEAGDDPEATARVKAFFARMVRPGGALPPKKPGRS
jgi:hypothetical protein